MTEPIWIEEHEALTLHNRLLALDGGASGIRDAGLLQSAIARPRQLHAYGNNPNVVDMAAAYISGIVGNHPFSDGNKRTGFLAGILFLELNGPRLTASEESAAQAVLNLAASTLEEPGVVSWLRTNVKHL
jgi:death-on-curing protein